ncbi:MAG: ligase [Firmicutes bacterium HGW-Firmicutes-14]|nr:MAG: ligase [Firmicutes bacterium HGW-Firmicutes-14]
MLWVKSSSFREKIYYIIIALFMAFPVIDYILRDILPIPLISSLWDEMLLAGGLMLVCIRLIFGSPRRSTRITKQIFVLILIGLAYLTLDLISLSVNLEGFRAVFQYMFVFFIGFYLIDRPEHIKSLLALAVITGSLIGLYGIYQWIIKVPMPSGWVDTTEAVKTRAFSIIGSPNALGSQMAMLAPVALGLFMEEKNLLKKSLWLAMAAVMAACLVFTGSRGAWLAFAGAIGLLGVIYDRRILFLGIAGAVAAVLFVPAVTERVTYLFTPEYMMKSAQSGRISRWLDAYDQMRNSPLFGAGLGHYGGAVARRTYSVPYTDNYYLKTMAEMGLLGVTMFFWLILGSLKEGYNAIKKLSSPGLKYMAAGMLGGLSVIALHNFVENIFEIPYLNTYFWLVAGLLASLPFAATRMGGGPVD